MKKMIVTILGIMLMHTLNASNLGTYGNTFKITEQDFIAYITQKMHLFIKKEGGKSAFIHRIQAKVQKEALNPKDPRSFKTVDHSNNYFHDPSIILKHDVTTPDGHILGHKGQRINPFHYISHYSKVLIFIDGSDHRQVEWVKNAIRLLQAKNRPYYIVLVNGNLQKGINALGSVKFDYYGTLSYKMGVKTVPSIVFQRGDKLWVQQIPCRENLCQGGVI